MNTTCSNWQFRRLLRIGVCLLELTAVDNEQSTSYGISPGHHLGKEDRWRTDLQRAEPTCLIEGL